MRPAKTPWIIQSKAREREVNKKWAKNDKRKTIRPRQKCVKVCKFDGDSFRWAQQKCRNRLAHTRAMTFSFFFCALPVAVNHVYLFTSSVCFFCVFAFDAVKRVFDFTGNSRKEWFSISFMNIFSVFFLFFDNQFLAELKRFNFIIVTEIAIAWNYVIFVVQLIRLIFNVFVFVLCASIVYLFNRLTFSFRRKPLFQVYLFYMKMWVFCSSVRQKKKRNIFRRNEHNLLNFNWLRPPKCDRKQRIIS